MKKKLGILAAVAIATSVLVIPSAKAADTVTIYGGFGDAQADAFQHELDIFGAANGITIKYTKLTSYDTDIRVKVKAGQSPDIGIWPQPGGLLDYASVLEPLSGYLLLAERLYEQGQTDAEGWNFGPHDEDARAVQWIVEHLCESWDKKATWTLQPGDHPHEANFLKLDISKARQRLQWTPRWSLQTSLTNITEWHKAWLAGRNMQDICLQQISQYQNQL